MIRHFILVMIACFSVVVYGQQEQLNTNFMFNKLNFNPAATGIDDGISTSLIYHNQWNKIPGAPNTTFFNIDANLNKLVYGSYGLTFMNDVIGDFRQNNVVFNFAAPFQIKELGMLNFGIGLGLVNLSSSPDYITPSGNNNDPSLPKGGSGSNFLVNFGLTWKSFKGYYFGFSSSNINKPEIKTLNFTINRYYFFIAGHKFKNMFGQNKDLEFQTLVRSNLLSNQADINVRYLHSNLFYAGVTYRVTESVDFLAGFYPLPNFTLGYSYDYQFNGLKPVSRGTHELVARYRYVIPDPPLERTKHPRWL